MRATSRIVFFVAIVCVLPALASAEPLSSSPLGGEEHGQLFHSQGLLDPAMLALPPLPKRDPATAFEPGNTSLVEPATGPVADSWMWQLTADSLLLPRQGPPPVREAPPAGRWARIAAKAAPILLAAGAVMALAVLMSLAQRR